MKVLDLQCGRQHVFEGWFGSDEDFRGQLARGLVTCPMCGDAGVQRRISAPRLTRKSNSQQQHSPPAAGHAAPQPPAPSAKARRGRPDPQPADAPPAQGMPDLARLRQAAYLKAVQHVMQHTEDVGARFAEEARRIHYGEIEARGIRGQATAREKAALAEEGIEVMSLPVPKDMDGPLQ